MSTVRVHDLRLSFVWIKAFPVAGPNPLLGDRLGDRIKYTQETNKARAGTSDLSLPWPAGRRHHFWEWYLETGDLDSVDGKSAWRHLMPFRSRSLARLSTPQADYRLLIEGFCYPHAVAAVVSIPIQTDLALYDMVAKANALRWGIYDVTWRDDGSAAPLTLQALATQTLDRLSDIAGNPGGVKAVPLDPPFSIATTANAEGVPDDQPNVANSEIHRALEALCTWSRKWKTAKLHPLDDFTSLLVKEWPYAPQGHLLYGLTHGRAVWLPGYFRDNFPAAKKIRFLGHYHRNLMFLSLQTASLLVLIRGVAGLLDRHQALSITLYDLASKAAGALGRIYGGAGCYRSWSARAQIESSRLTVNKVRSHVGLADLDVRKKGEG